jgi:hypothetical protein
MFDLSCTVAVSCPQEVEHTVAIRRSKYMKPDGPTSRLSGDCAIDGCRRPMFRKGLCCAHFKRYQRKKPVDGLIGEARSERGLELAEVLDPMEQVIDSGSAFLETLSEDDQLYKERRRAFIKSCEVLMLSRGWAPPKSRARARTRTRTRTRKDRS